MHRKKKINKQTKSLFIAKKIRAFSISHASKSSPVFGFDCAASACVCAARANKLFKLSLIKIYRKSFFFLFAMLFVVCVCVGG